VIRRILLAACAAALTLTGLAGPASADKSHFADRRGDNVRLDITGVAVLHSKTKVVVGAGVRGLEGGDMLSVWYDTVPRNPGPEYKLEVIANSDFGGVRRVAGWRAGGGQRWVRCRGMRATADGFGPDRVRTSVPRTCLRNPRRVRVTVRMQPGSADGRGQDWAPSRRQMFGWVHI
jgi:hypothetical protein